MASISGFIFLTVWRKSIKAKCSLALSSAANLLAIFLAGCGSSPSLQSPPPPPPPAPVLPSIALSPANSSFQPGFSLKLTVTGMYSDGSTKDLSDSASWASTNHSVATVDTSGNATAVATGSTTMQATVGSMNASTTLTVTPLGLLKNTGLWTQFERRGWPAEYYSGEIIQNWNQFDSVIGSIVSQEVSLELDKMKATGVNTITFQLRTSDPTYTGNFTPPDCNEGPALGLQFPQPLVPDAVMPGGTGFTLTVNGTGFVMGSVVNWNGSARATTFVSGSQLNASILASDIARPSTSTVTVVNPIPGGGTSNVTLFEVTPSIPAIGFILSSYGTNSQAWSVATGDFNRDGKLDVAVANPVTNTVSVFLGNGDGTFQSAVDYRTGTQPALSTQFCEPSSVGVGDFNGDGKTDLAVSNLNESDISVLLGNGDGTFQSAVNYATGLSPAAIAVGDFNQDGKLDLAVANSGCGSPCGNISVLLGNGDGTFQSPVNYVTGNQPGSVAVGDFNEDGKLDLVVANSSSGNISVLLGNGDGTFQAAVELRRPLLLGLSRGGRFQRRWQARSGRCRERGRKRWCCRTSGRRRRDVPVSLGLRRRENSGSSCFG